MTTLCTFTQTYWALTSPIGSLLGSQCGSTWTVLRWDLEERMTMMALPFFESFRLFGVFLCDGLMND
jgi:hypothetical protein